MAAATRQALGYAPQECPATLEAVLGAGADDVQRAMSRVAAQGQAQLLDLALMTSLGSTLRVRARVFRGPDGRYWMTAASAQDAAQARQTAEHLATHDILTGLPNRTLLADRLAMQAAECRRNHSGFAAVTLDLDAFGRINDAQGLLAGDELLRQVAHRLSECLRGVDTLARTGSDEFVILLANVPDESGAQVVLDRIEQMLLPAFYVFDQATSVKASTGLALFPEHTDNPADLLRLSSLALKHAKAAGEGSRSTFAPRMQARRSQEVSLDALMRQGLRDGEFTIFYQPLVDTFGRIKGCEALMRWIRADGTFVSPGEFIPVAEANGLITVLGDYVLRAASMQIKQFQEQGLPGLYVSINVSPRQLRQPGFVTGLRRVLKQTGVDPASIVLELTESLLMADQQQVAALLQEIVATGVRLSLDDFGTGYSCLAYLKTYPFSVVKIDRSFILDVETSEVSRRIVSAIIQLAKAIGMSTVVEGVESETQAEVVTSLGVDYLQGFLFSKPVPAAELLARWASKLGEQQAA